MNGSRTNTEPIGQNFIKLISNVCISVLVVSVLICTLVAITYQTPDPWLESAPALTKPFTQSENATFKVYDSVSRTGEDIESVAPPPGAVAKGMEPITEAKVKKEERVVNTSPNELDCGDIGVVNCSDPGVLIAVEKFNFRVFKSIVFFEYQTSVRGSKADECDVAWRFRKKKEKPSRTYKDKDKVNGKMQCGIC